MDTLTSRPVLTTGLACLAATLILRPLLLSCRPPRARSRTIPSPRQTLLPTLSPSQLAALPYPPTALPGARAVETPYGTTHVFEFGPLQGERVLLLAGLSTPCVALSNLAERLAARGCRVMLFDYFGRGWSDAPDPAEVDHDERLYASQVLCVLASSEVCWLGSADRARGGGGGGFHLIGYSFGGGLAAEFASWAARAVRSVTLIAPGGLVRVSGNSWRTRLLYSRGWLPECALQYLVRGQFEPAQVARPFRSSGEDMLAGEAELAEGEEEEEEVVVVVEEEEEERDEGAKKVEVQPDPFDHASIMSSRPDVTVASVMTWQLRHHVGFIPSVMSSFRYGPIHERYEEWARLGTLLAERRRDSSLPGLFGGRVLLVLGSSDSIVQEEQIVPDMRMALGDEDAVEVLVLDGGHEVAFTKAPEIADAAISFWTENQRAVPD